mmetsp:Transcript_20963/g.58315  ORF Transcript_20963/g.58315 Transcript_20963/m.58315 type:complete len:259 (+) Transcript_20963:325-1101(+)
MFCTCCIRSACASALTDPTPSSEPTGPERLICAISSASLATMACKDATCCAAPTLSSCRTAVWLSWASNLDSRAAMLAAVTPASRPGTASKVCRPDPLMLRISRALKRVSISFRSWACAFASICCWLSAIAASNSGLCEGPTSLSFAAAALAFFFFLGLASLSGVGTSWMELRPWARRLWGKGSTWAGCPEDVRPEDPEGIPVSLPRNEPSGVIWMGPLHPRATMTSSNVKPASYAMAPSASTNSLYAKRRPPTGLYR